MISVSVKNAKEFANIINILVLSDYRIGGHLEYTREVRAVWFSTANRELVMSTRINTNEIGYREFIADPIKMHESLIKPLI